MRVETRLYSILYSLQNLLMEGTQSIFVEENIENLIYKRTLSCSWSPLGLLHLQMHTLKIMVKFSKLKSDIGKVASFLSYS